MIATASRLPFDLPGELAERCTIVRDTFDGDRADGPVVAWLHHASRIHENPVLEVAAAAARAMDAPLLVHAGFGGSVAYANDRQTLFMLEGWAELQGRLAGLGVRMSITPPGLPEGSGLRWLASRARMLVTEDHPRAPYPAWTRRIAEHVSGGTISVDASCILPGHMVVGIHERAFKFRSACEKQWKDRIRRPELASRLEAPAARDHDLPPGSLDLAGSDSQSLADLVGRWPIDHAVGPVPDMTGGESEAIGRWSAFAEDGLARYHRRRNDAAIAGTSGLSPWLHHGMIAPTRLAREAAAIGGDGPDKFLDELLVWRELAFHFCRTHPDHDEYGAIPAWARETLASHARDDRSRLSWETLARGRTGDRLWDLAQASLRERGWLHNNLRMTWGKALLGWSNDARETLSRLLDLNDRYALDGNDPNSIGGLLWCLGLFDRPFEEDHVVTGTIRTRPTTVHARRLDLAGFEESVVRRVRRSPVLVIGAGVAGSMAARTLADHGHDVTLLDKGRGPGGRLSTRRRGADRDIRHDHGCQVLRLRGDLRRDLTRSWIEDDVVTAWSPRVRSADGETAPPSDPWFVGKDGMNSLLKHLQADLRVRFAARVDRLERGADEWKAVDADGNVLGAASRVVLAIPAPQSADLLRSVPAESVGVEPETLEAMAAVEYEPTWTFMVDGVSHDPGFDVAVDPTDSVRWLVREASRPGRRDAGAWTMHASPEWTRRHLEAAPDEVEPELRRLASEILGCDVPEGDVHRWRHGLVDRALGRDCFRSADRRLVVCGDWCLGGRVEHAIESGIAAAGMILRDRSSARIEAAAGTLFEAS